MRRADKDVRCFVALSHARLEALRATSPAATDALNAAFEEAAVVVSLDHANDVDSALEIVRQAREWLVRSPSDDAALALLLEAALVRSTDGRREPDSAAPRLATGR